MYRPISYRQISHKITVILSIIVCCTLPASGFSQVVSNTTASTEVHVKVNNSNQALQLRYPTTVRLEQVLQDALPNLNQLPSLDSEDAIYWFGSALWQSDSATRKMMKRKQFAVVQQLQQLALHWQSTQPQTSHSLQTMAKSLSVPLPGQRIFQSLDWDWVRISPEQNPGLNGRFEMQLMTRPQTVKIFGALSQPSATINEISLPWQERKDAADYLQQVTLLTASNRDYVWAIQPDGKAEQHEIAYWNRNHKDIAPGAILYLPLTSLPHGYESLNDNIVDLLKQRPF